MKFKKDIFYISIIIVLFLISCGQSLNFTLPSPQQATPSVEFQQWCVLVKSKSPQEFVIWWNNEEYKNWTFAWYHDYNPNSILYWPDYSVPQEIYDSKIINCHRFTILMRYCYGGKYVWLYWKKDKQTHAVLWLDNKFLSLSGNTASFAYVQNLEQIKNYFQADFVGIVKEKEYNSIKEFKFK